MCREKSETVTKQELIEAYEEWFCKYHWIFFGALTFRESPSPSRADRIFKRWIAEMQQNDGTKDFRWVRVTEHGAFGDNLHFHVLIGGLTNDAEWWPWVRRWDALAGDAVLSYYCKNAGGIPYMLKTALPGRDFEIDFDLRTSK
jgi:hypothetical protein